MIEHSSAVTAEPPTQEYVLRAMVANYTSGGALDHLDLEVFAKAADEIKRLRACIPAQQPPRKYSCEYCSDHRVVGRRYPPDWKLNDEPCPKCAHVEQSGVLAQKALKPEIIDTGGRNPMIVVSPDQVVDWLRSIADVAGYADRSSVAVQVKTVGILGDETIRTGPPQLLLMVSNIPHSRTPAVPSPPCGTPESQP